MTYQMQEIEEVIDRLEHWCRSRGFAGIDPYDSLNSPLVSLLTLGTRWGRMALTQFGRRSPINCRPLLGIRPGVNPKAIGLFLEGYTKEYRRSQNPQTKVVLNELFQKLLELRSPDVSGAAWGYNFPWQSRVQLTPRWTPTIVNSSFIGHALLDYYEATDIVEALDIAQSIPAFFLNDLRRKTEGDSFCFSYTPLDVNYVHNANMLGASLLARLAAQYDRRELLDPALCALRYSMKYQHDDGSWFYAETKAQSWIDSFHTGFNLEALRRFLQFDLTPEYQDAYRRGVEFYADRFFLDDGTPKYYHDRLYLVDIHAPAEAIYFFSGEGQRYRELVERILHWTLMNMRDAKRGTFYFRKAKRFTIKTPYMRWSQAWAFRALTEFLTHEVMD
ncbi:MAG: delta-aminolevulinic acid dehydratase [Planctomycetia bacterium]|nr:delta-aminolevulinic acid dehydratase [Planctomycetia bacterium]